MDFTLQPQVGPSLGDALGISKRLAALERQVTQLATSQTRIEDRAISASKLGDDVLVAAVGSRQTIILGAGANNGTGGGYGTLNYLWSGMNFGVDPTVYAFLGALYSRNPSEGSEIITWGVRGNTTNTVTYGFYNHYPAAVTVEFVPVLIGNWTA
jgi:hypothetical protein